MSALGTQGRLNVVINNKKSVMVNQSGAIAVRRLSDLLDVDISSKEDGSLIIYDEDTGKFKSSTLLDKQEMNGGHF